MTSKSANRYSPEFRERAVRMLLDQVSLRQAASSVMMKIRLLPEVDVIFGLHPARAVAI